MFENVTYGFYSGTLGRDAVPDEAEFNRYALENKLYMKTLVSDGLVTERDENGIASAVCMMIECDYIAARIASGAENADTSESINGYSHSMSTAAQDKQRELDAKSTAAKKYHWIRLYCDITGGVL